MLNVARVAHVRHGGLSLERHAGLRKRWKCKSQSQLFLKNVTERRRLACLSPRRVVQARQQRMYTDTVRAPVGTSQRCRRHWRRPSSSVSPPPPANDLSRSFARHISRRKKAQQDLRITRLHKCAEPADGCAGRRERWCCSVTDLSGWQLTRQARLALHATQVAVQEPLLPQGSGQGKVRTEAGIQTHGN